MRCQPRLTGTAVVRFIGHQRARFMHVSSYHRGAAPPGAALGGERGTEERGSGEGETRGSAADLFCTHVRHCPHAGFGPPVVVWLIIASGTGARTTLGPRECASSGISSPQTQLQSGPCGAAEGCGGGRSCEGGVVGPSEKRQCMYQVVCITRVSGSEIGCHQVAVAAIQRISAAVVHPHASLAETQTSETAVPRPRRKHPTQKQRKQRSTSPPQALPLRTDTARAAIGAAWVH